MTTTTDERLCHECDEPLTDGEKATGLGGTCAPCRRQINREAERDQ